MNLNKAFILGNLTRDPETKSTASGQNVCRFSVATNRVWTDKMGQKQQKAEFHNIIAWGKLADICSQYLQKGKLVLIEGRIENRSWTAPDGIKKYWTEIIAEKIQLGPKGLSTPQDTPFNTGFDKSEATLEGVPIEGEIPPTEEEIEVKDIPF